jgi:hypothetical protein
MITLQALHVTPKSSRHHAILTLFEIHLISFDPTATYSSHKPLTA